MVRNSASSNQSVVSEVTIIDVSNDDMKLKPGMTANVSIIVTQRPGVLRVGNARSGCAFRRNCCPEARKEPKVEVVRRRHGGDDGR